jgi:hypothetical protein
MTRDYLTEAALGQRLRTLDMGGCHEYGWSWTGGCNGSYALSKEHPEIAQIEPKGAVYPGSMGHYFMQEHALPAGFKLGNLQILAHEQARFIPLKYGLFRMSPTDTLCFDRVERCFVIIDYKFIKDLSWVEQEAKEDNKEQVNLYAHTSGAKYYIIFYVDKQNYDKFKLHKYEMDPILAKKDIEKLLQMDAWQTGHREGLLWTNIATGLNHLSYGAKKYRYMCDANRDGDYLGCPYKKYCLEYLSKQFNQEFTSFIRYDEFLKTKV